MSKTNLVAVLQKLIKEGPESAQDDLHQYFLETCVDINESFNESDETESDAVVKLTSSADEHDVKKIIDALESKGLDGRHEGDKIYVTKRNSDADYSEALSDIRFIAGVEDVSAKGTDVEECSDIDDESMDEAESDEDIADDAADDAAVDAADDSEADADVAVSDISDIDGDEDGDIDSLGDAGEVDLEDKVEDLETQLADLQAQFMALTGQGPLDSETVEIDPEDDSDTLVTTDDGEESPIDGSEEEDEDATDESMTFEDEDFADLEEAYQLEKVQDPNLSGGKEIGANGQKITVNDKSPTLQKKVSDRIGGEPVEVISDEHNGYDREPSPGVKDVTIAKNQQKKANQELKGVSKDGDKSALINKNDGFGADNTKSPVVPTKSLQK